MATELDDVAAQSTSALRELMQLRAYADALNARCVADATDAERYRVGLTEIRDRIKEHPAYADLTEAEEMETGGDTAELSYLARVADVALGRG